MFTANQNIALREHKRRVVAFVESTISEEALEMDALSNIGTRGDFMPSGTNAKKNEDLQEQGT